MPNHPQRQQRLARYPELKPLFGIGWSRMHCDRLEKQGRFPRKVRIGPNTVGYFSDEIEDFLESRAAARESRISQQRGREESWLDSWSDGQAEAEIARLERELGEAEV